MEGFTNKTFTTSRNFVYNYYIHRPAAPTTKPALILCHGFPDDAFLWKDIVPALVDSGHAIVVPDMLGYGGTSKPTDPSAYSSKGMSHDAYELLDSEGIDKIVPVGHDWGSYAAQRIYNWNPDRCAGLVLLNVAYMPPQKAVPFDLAGVLDLTEKMLGYPAFAYWEFFTADDAPKAIDDNLEAFFHLLHWDDYDAMTKLCCVRGATRDLVTTAQPQDVPLKPYAQAPGFKDAFLQRFRRDGFTAPLCWYRATVSNVQFEAEKEIPDENLPIKNPCLYLSGTRDTVCRTDGMEQVKALVPDLQTFIVESNHWTPFEKPVEIRERIASWLKEKYPGSA